MSDKKTKDFTTFEYDGKTYVVRRPNNKVRRNSDAVYAQAYRDALKNGFLLDSEIDDLLEDRGFSRKAVGQRRNKLMKKIRDMEVKIAHGEFKSLEAGRDMCFQIADWRDELWDIDKARTELEAQTVERNAENRRFNYFAFACVTTEDGDSLWDDFEDFENDNSELATKAATELLMLVYGINQEASKEVVVNRVENRWLRKHGFMNDELQLIDKDGRLIDREGHTINEKGEYVDDDGHRVDLYGNRLDDEGNLLFLEDLEDEELEEDDEGEYEEEFEEEDLEDDVTASKIPSVISGKKD
jgi:hypothetical protein